MGLIIFAVCLVVLSIIGALIVLGGAESGTAGVVAFIIFILLSGGMTWMNYKTAYSNDHWATCTITGKDRGGDDGSYRVYTSDCGQLANKDSYLRGKFNSADIWEEIPNEGQVRLRIVGVRIPIISQFPNIFEVEPVGSIPTN